MEEWRRRLPDIFFASLFLAVVPFLIHLSSLEDHRHEGKGSERVRWGNRVVTGFTVYLLLFLPFTKSPVYVRQERGCKRCNTLYTFSPLISDRFFSIYSLCLFSTFTPYESVSVCARVCLSSLLGKRKSHFSHALLCIHFGSLLNISSSPSEAFTYPRSVCQLLERLLLVAVVRIKLTFDSTLITSTHALTRAHTSYTRLKILGHKLKVWEGEGKGKWRNEWNEGREQNDMKWSRVCQILSATSCLSSLSLSLAHGLTCTRNLNPPVSALSLNRR